MTGNTPPQPSKSNSSTRNDVRGTDRNSDGASSLRKLGVITATLLVVANMVGTGVFTTTGFLIRDLGSPLAVLTAWLIGGLLALFGALSYGELVAALPRNGGEYHLLGRIYHPMVGFVAGWLSLVVGFSAPIAAAALAFGRYFGAIAPASVSPTVAALVLIIVLSVLHALNVAIGGGVQNVFTVVKVTLIAIMIGGGFLYGDLSGAIASGPQPISEAIFSPAFAVGLIFISFAYSGWNGAAYIAGEVRRPAWTLPIALSVGTVIVVALYLGLNLTFLAAAPAEELAGVVEVGHVAAVHLFGESAGRALSAVIALALVSSVSAMIMAGPRVYQAMGEDFRRLRFLSSRTAGGGPAAAVTLQAVVSAVLVVTMTFETLLTYIGFTLSLCTGLTAVGVLVLRRREPELKRPYRVWGYPVTPILFVALSAWMAGHTLIQRPFAAVTGFATLALGVVVYLGVRTKDRNGRG